MVLAEPKDTATVSQLSGDVYSFIQSAFFDGADAEFGHPIYQAFFHHFGKKGAGVRGRLTCRTAELLHQSSHDGCCLAAAVESLHNASLIQDDMQDRSLMRRGQSSVASSFGEAVALGLTDRLITTAFACIAPLSKPNKLPALLRRLNMAVAQTVDGQTSELCWPPEDVALAARLQAATRKSGPLFALSLELPLILADQEEWVEVAHQAACQFGLGYQILDDIKDRFADAQAGASGNLVLAMELKGSSNAAVTEAVRLVEDCLLGALAQAKRLPFGAGSPLVEMVEKLWPQVHALSP